MGLLVAKSGRRYVSRQVRSSVTYWPSKQKYLMSRCDNHTNDEGHYPPSRQDEIRLTIRREQLAHPRVQFVS